MFTIKKFIIIYTLAFVMVLSVLTAAYYILKSYFILSQADLIFIITGTFFFVIFILLINLINIKEKILEPLKKLSLSVKSAANKGDVKTRIEIKGKNELADLAGDINLLLDRIDSYYINLLNKIYPSRDSDEKLHKTIELSPDGIVLTDEEGRITEWNEGMFHITGLNKKDIINQYLWDIRHQLTMPERKTKESYEKMKNCMLELLQTGKSTILNKIREYEILNQKGNINTVQIVTFAVNTSKGYIECSIMRDITEKKKMEEKLIASLQEKETLLKEIHHRVKNNLQTVAGLLSLQMDYVKNDYDRGIFHDSITRVKSMAIIHELIYKKTDFLNIPFGDYITDLTSYLFATYRGDFQKINLDIKAENINMNIGMAIPCGLIVNEMVTNSLKYAFPDNKSGTIKIIFKQNKPGSFVLQVSDNGSGMPQGMDIKNLKSLGIKLIQDLARQIEGELEYIRENGFGVIIKFKKEN